MNHTKNIYFAYKEVGTTLEYRILLNVGEKGKAEMYLNLEREGFKVRKVLANE